MKLALMMPAPREALRRESVMEDNDHHKVCGGRWVTGFKAELEQALAAAAARTSKSAPNACAFGPKRLAGSWVRKQ